MTAQTPILKKIEKRNVGPEKPGFTFKQLLLCLLLGPSLIFMVIDFFTSPWYQRETFTAFFVGLLFGAPLVAIVGLFFGRYPSKERLARLQKFFEGVPDAFFSEAIRFSYNVSGIALTPTEVLVGMGETVYYLPYDRIRRVYWEVPGYDQVIVYGNPGAVFHADMVNAANRGRAMNQSGLFVEVADVNTPLLQLNTTNVAVLRRINEAVNQAFEHYEARSDN